ncbi:PDR/VanB family oxidoreductase [Amycolatopsis sp. NPDC021455]|uniref:PDR/VanB family oxidoreductase n=1 Tax=Amycolatopsis sp. NPDC021455 TaxID=3154901 RepID=UPI0033FB9CCC
MHPPTFEAVVASRTELADGVVGFDLLPAGGGELPPWTPGAHIDVALGGLIRQYSLCSSPIERAYWRIAVLHEPAGRGGSRYLHEKARVGTVLRVTGPRNRFPLVDAPGYLFVAGGIGITPLLPMVHEVAARGVPWRLVYGGRTRASMAFTGELARHGEHVEFLPQDESGPLPVARLVASAAGQAVYCCGPSGLLDAVRAHCAGSAVASVHTEAFTGADPVEGAEFDVVLERSGLTLTVPPGVSVLEAVRAAGVGVLSSCEQGTCGTCETVVLHGRPEHHDSLLSEAERETGDVMMICVSRSAGPKLVLDL